MMKVLVTGAAGFIGFHITKKLLEKKISVVGLDNFNKYYDPKLKFARYKELRKINNKFRIYKIDLKNYTQINRLFKKKKFNIVIHLAAQAGVRYSIENPDSYFDSNIVGFYNVLKNCKIFKIKHLISASSSSVYGDFSFGAKEDTSRTDKPLQFYAATKKSNEVMCHAFSNIYKMPISVLRFFTVYGPWGRPDMSLFKFTNKIINKKTIKLYNKGRHSRDYTYIDDITNGLFKLIKKKPKKKSNPIEIYNFGNSKSINLKFFLKELVRQLKIPVKILLCQRQKGDILKTLSSIRKARSLINYKPTVNYKEGIRRFLIWYKKYYKIIR